MFASIIELRECGLVKCVQKLNNGLLVLKNHNQTVCDICAFLQHIANYLLEDVKHRYFMGGGVLPYINIIHAQVYAFTHNRKNGMSDLSFVHTYTI